MVLLREQVRAASASAQLLPLQHAARQRPALTSPAAIVVAARQRKLWYSLPGLQALAMQGVSFALYMLDLARHAQAQSALLHWSRWSQSRAHRGRSCVHAAAIAGPHGHVAAGRRVQHLLLIAAGLPRPRIAAVEHERPVALQRVPASPPTSSMLLRCPSSRLLRVGQRFSRVDVRANALNGSLAVVCFA